MALLNSFNSGVAGIKTFSKSLEVIGDNIANVNTTGFKGSRVTNEDFFVQTLRTSSGGNGADNPGMNTMQVGGGSAVASISQVFTQGALTSTGGPADLGISGKGFFKVRNPTTNEFFYTRAGDFRLDDNGFLLTNQGYNVMSGVNPIQIPVNKPAAQAAQAAPGAAATQPTLQSYQIAKDGNITAYYSDGSTISSKQPTQQNQQPAQQNQQAAGQSINQILLSAFGNPNALERRAGNLFENTGDAAGVTEATAQTASQLGDIIQGTLELSNVDLTQQFSDLIVAQRAFQANSRVITVSDSVMEEVVNLKR